MDVSPAGAARSGDLVTAEVGAEPTVVVPFKGGDYPEPTTEVFRLGRDRIAGLKARADLLRELRLYFAEQDFLEIEPPTMVPSPGLEINIKAVSAGDGYLITSPEFAMKRLLAGGLERIYTACRCFRAEEEGAEHLGEFTMVEWYRAWDDSNSILDDTEQIVSRCVRAVRGDYVAIARGRKVDVQPPWLRLTIAEAFQRWAGIELSGHESASELAAKARAAGLDLGTAKEWDDVFYVIFVEKIEPGLQTIEKAVVLTDWPVPLAALAKRKPESPQWADRFEVYIGGLELANAFGELTDPVEQRRRFEEELEARRNRGLDVYPLDEKFLAALEEGLPPCSGIALGLDRLAMLCAGVDQIRLVSAFTASEL